VERIYDELQATGTVETHLPEEERRVRDLYAQEVLARRLPSPGAAEVFPFRPRERVVTRVDRAREARKEEAMLASAEVIPLRRPGPMEPAAATVPLAAAAAVAHAANVTHKPMLFVVPNEPPRAADRAADRATSPPAADRSERSSSGVVAEAAARRHAPESPARMPADASGAGGAAEASQLTLDHDIADGPAIGAKTVKRLRALGIETVRDLLKADPAALAVRLNARSITAQAIGDWQDQALLMCAVAGLRPTHAQLLVGAGYRSAEAIAEAEADKLCADVLAFAATPPGQRVLRSAGVPDMERIKGWQETARRMQAA
jgi:hypothetical protein